VAVAPRKRECAREKASVIGARAGSAVDDDTLGWEQESKVDARVHFLVW
jgi:hypothetical protein